MVHPVVRSVTNYLNYNGLTRGLEQIDVRPRVQGYLKQINFKADTQVKKGDLLFVIDQRPFKIAVDRAKAELAGKKATTQSAWANLDRVKQLQSQGAASEQELIDRQAAYDLAVADVGVAQAELDEAQQNLDYTEIRAEISGRVSRNLVDVGTLVKINDTLLATIINDSQVYVDFSVPEADYLDYLRRNPRARMGEANLPPTIVEVGLANDQGYPHVGRVVAADNMVDTSTATLGIRALFDNPNKWLAPGLYVRVRAIVGTADSVLIPDVALQFDQRGQFVMVVIDRDGQKVAARRDVKAAQQIGPMRRIIEGVTPEDVVIVNGLQRVRPELPVDPTVVQPPELPTTAPATQPTTLPSTQPATTQPTP